MDSLAFPLNFSRIMPYHQPGQDRFGHTGSAILHRFLASGAVAVSHDRSTVEAVVQHYFDGLYEGSADKLGAIFHPSADLRWLEKGALQVLTVPDWLDRVKKRPSAKAEGKPREDFIVTIDRSDDSTAFIKVRCQLPPRYFTDYLVAMKLNDGWQIVSKSYRYDLRE
jgi:Putative lumazine-binding